MKKTTISHSDYSSYITPNQYKLRLEKASNIFLYQEIYHRLGFSINVDMTDEEREDYIEQLVNNYELILKNR